MATLLLELEENRTFNRTLFPAKLFVYNDLLIYTKRHWLSVREVTFAYNQIAQFNLIKGVFFAQIGLVTTGTDDIELKFVNRAKAIQAKKIIDQKVYRAHHINKVEKPERPDLDGVATSE